MKRVEYELEKIKDVRVSKEKEKLCATLRGSSAVYLSQGDSSKDDRDIININTRSYEQPRVVKITAISGQSKKEKK